MLLMAISHMATTGWVPDASTITQIMAGVGLVVAKDNNVSGGTK